MRPHNYVELMGFSLTLCSPAYYGLKRKRRKYRKNITYHILAQLTCLLNIFCDVLNSEILACCVSSSIHFQQFKINPYLPIGTKYVWFWGCKGHTTVWPYTLQLIQKLPGYSMMTLDLDKSNVCNLHFCLPHPIISFLWNSQCFVNESTKHEFLEIKSCYFFWFPLKLKPTSPLLGTVEVSLYYCLSLAEKMGGELTLPIQCILQCMEKVCSIFLTSYNLILYYIEFHDSFRLHKLFTTSTKI